MPPANLNTVGNNRPPTRPVTKRDSSKRYKEQPKENTYIGPMNLQHASTDKRPPDDTQNEQYMFAKYLHDLVRDQNERALAAAPVALLPSGKAQKKTPENPVTVIKKPRSKTDSTKVESKERPKDGRKKGNERQRHKRPKSDGKRKKKSHKQPVDDPSLPANTQNISNHYPVEPDRSEENKSKNKPDAEDKPSVAPNDEPYDKPDDTPKHKRETNGPHDLPENENNDSQKSRVLILLVGVFVYVIFVIQPIFCRMLLLLLLVCPE